MKFLKIILTVIISPLALVTKSVNAQNLIGYSNLEILVGVNALHLYPNISLTFDKERSSKFTFGMGIISQYNSTKPSSQKDGDLTANLIVAGGPHLKYRFADSRNFIADFQFGAYLGYMNNNYIYFPNVKLKQSFYLNPKTRLVIGQGLIYYFQKNVAIHKYDPQLHLGICFNI